MAQKTEGRRMERRRKRERKGGKEIRKKKIYCYLLQPTPFYNDLREYNLKSGNDKTKEVGNGDQEERKHKNVKRGSHIICRCFLCETVLWGLEGWRRGLSLHGRRQGSAGRFTE